MVKQSIAVNGVSFVLYGMRGVLVPCGMHFVLRYVHMHNYDAHSYHTQEEEERVSVYFLWSVLLKLSGSEVGHY